MSQERTLHLYGVIDADTVAPILEEIIRINNEDELLYHQAETEKVSALPRKPIHLYINSAGGNMYDCFTLLSAMIASKTPIYTYAGYAMSAGLTLFLAGSRRFGGIFSTFMFHDPTEDLGKDKFSNMENRLAETKRIKDIRTKYICDRTKLTVQDFELNKYIDVFMDVHQAQTLGIVHEIV